MKTPDQIAREWSDGTEMDIKGLADAIRAYGLALLEDLERRVKSRWFSPGGSSYLDTIMAMRAELKEQSR